MVTLILFKGIDDAMIIMIDLALPTVAKEFWSNQF